MKAQFKYADKVDARFVLTLGDDELSQQMVKVKDMSNGEVKEVALNVSEIANLIRGN